MRPIKIGTLLLLILLIAPVLSSFLIESAKADEYGWGVFLPNNIQGVDSGNKVWYSTVICDDFLDALLSLLGHLIVWGNGNMGLGY
jgi:hypothetical protein